MNTFDLYGFPSKNIPIWRDKTNHIFKFENPYYGYLNYFGRYTLNIESIDFMEAFKKLLYLCQHHANYYSYNYKDDFIEYKDYKIMIKKIIFYNDFELASIYLYNHIRWNSIFLINLSKDETREFILWIGKNNKNYSQKIEVVCDTKKYNRKRGKRVTEGTIWRMCKLKI